MGKNTGKIVSNLDSKRQTHLNNLLFDKDFKKFQELVEELVKKHSFSPEELVKAATKKETIDIPVSIYSGKDLSTLEATIKYLKENLGLKYSDISKLLLRNQRTVWSTYANSQKKSAKIIKPKQGISIPIKQLSNRTFSILESVVGFLKDEKNMRFSDIARTLSLDPRTIWTCYFRLKKKLEGKNEAK